VGIADLNGKTVTRKIEDWKLSWVNTQDFDGPVGLVFGDTNKNGKIEPDEKTVDNMWLGDYVSSSAPIYKNDFGHMAGDMGATW
jgi:muramoyltetrapeptide carboxypeptidase LdcA involved in peptidoglycan recycling